MTFLQPTRALFLTTALLSAVAVCSFAHSNALAQGAPGIQTTPAPAADIQLPPTQATAQAAPAVLSQAPQTADAPASAQHIAPQQTPAQLFASATEHYAAENFAAAAEQFAQLADSSPALAVYYNLGNAYARLGQYGHAIAAYEKARALAPSQPDVLANLERARQAAGVTTAPASRWQQYARQLSPNAWTLLLAISFWAALGLWLIPAQFRRPHGIWRPSLLALAVAILLLSLAGLYPWLQICRTGTVLGADTPLLLAPVTTSPVQSYAQAGQSAQWVGSHGNFDRIRLADGTEGWIARKQFATTWQIRDNDVH